MQKKIIRFEHPRRSHMVGDGFRVSQYIPGYGREMSNDTSPFLMLDYNHPWEVPPQGEYRPGVGYHPHRGFETVTIVYSGELEHCDTAGGGGTIGPDEVQWMTAGSGLLHNEFMTHRFARTGGIMHAVQLWVNLPKVSKITTPRYQALTRENIPEIHIPGGNARIIAGEFSATDTLRNEYRQSGIAETFSRVDLSDIRFQDASELVLHLPEWHNAMILVVEWELRVSDRPLQQGDMVFYSLSGTDIPLRVEKTAKILVMAGQPLDEPVAAYGPFVMNTVDELEEAFRDFRAGKMGTLPENDE